MLLGYNIYFRLMICSVCRKACLDSFGEHAVHCKKLSGFKYIHDLAKDVLFDIVIKHDTYLLRKKHL